MTQGPYSFRLTEEIARWAFEVHVRTTDWLIVFTNPTAGPWKRLMARDADGIEGEVHRFAREEDRPDLVLVNDMLQTLLVVEAKDGLAALATSAQVTRSCGVIQSLSEALRLRSENPYWLARSGYEVLPGLLWATETPISSPVREQVFLTYQRELELIEFAHSGLVGIEVRRLGDDLSLAGFVSSRPGDDLPARALNSLEL